MAVTVKSLATGALTGTSGTAADVYAPSKSAIIKNMRFFNSHDAAVTINVFLKPSSGTKMRILPKDISLPPGFFLIEDQELTLGSGDKIQSDASTASKVEFILSGMERD